MATRSELLTALQGASGVIDADFANDPAPVPDLDNLWHVDVIYVFSASSATKSDRKRMLIQGADADTGEAEWENNVPEPLRTPGPGPYMSARTVNGWGALTEREQYDAIHTILSDIWREAESAPGREDLRSLQLTAEAPDTLKFTADFQASDGKWTPGTWYMKMTDPDGSVDLASGNVVFQEVV